MNNSYRIATFVMIYILYGTHSARRRIIVSNFLALQNAFAIFRQRYSYRKNIFERAFYKCRRSAISSENLCEWPRENGLLPLQRDQPAPNDGKESPQSARQVRKQGNVL